MIIQDDDADALTSEVEAVQASRAAMESAMAGPSAAHPVEGYGADNLSLATVTDECTSLMLQQSTLNQIIDMFPLRFHCKTFYIS